MKIVFFISLVVLLLVLVFSSFLENTGLSWLVANWKLLNLLLLFVIIIELVAIFIEKE